ncbi:catalase [Ascochyta rabiei]|uniref:Catalase n=1 Tax=Didymella rabiei TaxID=5454 RepID=A0A162YTC2_DIDRA|nr:catalase [Ascochyta rabiei]
MNKMQQHNFKQHRHSFRATHVKTQGIVKGKPTILTDLPPTYNKDSSRPQAKPTTQQLAMQASPCSYKQIKNPALGDSVYVFSASRASASRAQTKTQQRKISSSITRP